MESPERPELSSSGNVVKPVRRDYVDRVAHKGKDVDALKRAIRIRTFMWTFAAGSLMGLVVGLRVGHPFLGMIVGVAVLYGGATLIVEGSGRAAGVLHNPSGATTPRDKEYSQAESLVMRGDYQGAVDAYELATHEDPGDATPYIRIARIKRDHLQQQHDAVRWFRRALEAERVSAGQRILAQRELVELYVHQMGQPAKAAPYLARMVEELQGTVDGEWAEREYKTVKAAIAAELGREPEEPGEATA